MILSLVAERKDDEKIQLQELSIIVELVLVVIDMLMVIVFCCCWNAKNLE